MMGTLRTFFTNMAVATEALGKIAGSMGALEGKPPPLTTVNICPHCMTTNGSAEQSPSVADTGECGQCGRVGDVYDLELLGLYQGMGISAQDVWQHLPRLRQRYAKDAIISSRTVGQHLLTYIQQHRQQDDPKKSGNKK